MESGSHAYNESGLTRSGGSLAEGGENVVHLDEWHKHKADHSASVGLIISSNNNAGGNHEQSGNLCPAITRRREVDVA